MLDFAYDDDPIGPAGSMLLADAGLDSRIVRQAIADDRAMRCPERAAVFPERRFADLIPEPPAERDLHGAATEPFLSHPSRRSAR